MSNVIMDERELAERSKAADDSMEKLRRMRDGSDYERGRRDGRREALEEAAKVADSPPFMETDVADAIRDLVKKEGEE